MSLVPLLFSDWWEDLEYPHQLFSQNFGLGINPEDMRNILLMPQRDRSDRRLRTAPTFYYRPWGELMRNKGERGTSTVKADKDKFQVVLDVQQFNPEEITVKVVDKFVVVEAKHEERKDEHGTISRQFVRKYMIPEQCDIDQVSSNLSSDGILTIITPRKDRPMMQNERMVHIEQTGKPAIQEKSSDKPDKEEKKED